MPASTQVLTTKLMKRGPKLSNMDAPVLFEAMHICRVHTKVSSPLIFSLCCYADLRVEEKVVIMLVDVLRNDEDSERKALVGDPRMTLKAEDFSPQILFP